MIIHGPRKRSLLLRLQKWPAVVCQKKQLDIFNVQCSVCEHVQAPVDPMKSEETDGWLHGELRAPT